MLQVSPMKLSRFARASILLSGSLGGRWSCAGPAGDSEGGRALSQGVRQCTGTCLYSSACTASRLLVLKVAQSFSKLRVRHFCIDYSLLGTGKITPCLVTCPWAALADSHLEVIGDGSFSARKPPWAFSVKITISQCHCSVDNQSEAELLPESMDSLQSMKADTPRVVARSGGWATWLPAL